MEFIIVEFIIVSSSKPINRFSNIWGCLKEYSMSYEFHTKTLVKKILKIFLKWESHFLQSHELQPEFLADCSKDRSILRKTLI